MDPGAIIGAVPKSVNQYSLERRGKPGGADSGRSIVVRPVPAAALEMKCAAVAKEQVARPPEDGPDGGPIKPFAPPDVPPICRRVLPLDTTTTSTSEPPTTTSASPPPPTTTP